MSELFTNLPKARTSLLRSLQKAFQLAVAANEPGAPSAEELAELATGQTRRDFLATTTKLGVLVGAGGLLAACEKVAIEPGMPGTTGFADAKGTGPRIAIVGAGMAGLNCAYQLKKAGVRADIYEASNRVGGRIFTASGLMGSGVTTELGGEFIDSGHADMLGLVQEFGLPLYDVESPSETVLTKDAYFFGGQHHSVAQVIQAFQPYANQIQADGRSLPNNNITYDHLSASAARFDQLSISAYFDSIGMTGWIRTLLEEAYVTEFGREANDQTSINFLWMFQADASKGTFDIFGISDERYKIKGGNQQLVDAVAAQLPGQITLQRKLVALSQSGAAYQLTFELPDRTRTVVTADYVALTIPFTILRTVALNLPLPAWKTNAIQNLGYGTNAKLFLGFNGRPWRTNGYTGYFFSDTVTQGGWDGSQMQPGNVGTFTVFVGGQVGVDMGTGTPQSQAGQHLAVLDAAWPGLRAAFNGNVQRFHWPTHPHTLASYACYRVGQYSTIAGAEGKPVGNLFFAGEHCSAWYQGYMNGAAETGRLAASGIQAALRSGTTALVHRFMRRREQVLAV
ncbi:FAD-dependent oxidoreductase [Microvirga sp. STS02]|uniref:NAD(P)/FAD-dependent oxidoreductase n=1 Tax=Hymenobacter negativus TaxID=2795026 RepID=UPI0018DDB220|nr:MULTISPECIES: NAD(P)/FAD-dependent oxidoreductase [Bacteria]MBH8570452.1 FAD-dependent oxidoreductase [Hymenobacter negativus]MBR7210191.1 FAD-dependent oxidoreductase [Microvirga sp. STS02]